MASPRVERDLARHHAGKLSPQESEIVLSRGIHDLEFYAALKNICVKI